MMIAASDFVVDYWGAILAVLFSTPPGLRLLFKVSRRHRCCATTFVKLPFLGDVILTQPLRFLRSLILTESRNCDH